MENQAKVVLFVVLSFFDDIEASSNENISEKKSRMTKAVVDNCLRYTHIRCLFVT